MRMPVRLPRIRISLLLLVIVPWAIVGIVSLRYWMLPAVPIFEGFDTREIQAIANALNDYAVRYGEYPPDFSSDNPRKEIDDHLKKIFPDRDALRDLPPNVDQLGPDNALEFWLRGFYDGNPKCPLTGKIYLGLDPVTSEEVWIEIPSGGIMAEVYDGDAFSLLTSEGIIPIDAQDQSLYEDLVSNYSKLSGSRKDTLEVMLLRNPSFVFDRVRLSGRNSYRPKCCTAPLVYFRGGNYASARYRDNPRWGVAAPYQTVAADGTRDFEQPFRYQIISAGRDNYYGADSIVTSEAGFHQGHADNLTSFAQEPIGAQQLLAAREHAFHARNLSLLAAIVFTLAYPLSFLLDRTESGMVALSRITGQQFQAMHCSHHWKQRLDAQRLVRRDRALTRLREESLEDSQLKP